MMLHKGFTLIELLVVIAIIGILSAIVLASLNAARDKGANAAIKSNLANMRAEAQVYYDNNGTYGVAVKNCFLPSTVFTDPSFVNARASIIAASVQQPFCQSSATHWMMASWLKVAEGLITAWCVDDSGVSKGQTTSQLATDNSSGILQCQ